MIYLVSGFTFMVRVDEATMLLEAIYHAMVLFADDALVQ